MHPQFCRTPNAAFSTVCNARERTPSTHRDVGAGRVGAIIVAAVFARVFRESSTHVSAPYSAIALRAAMWWGHRRWGRRRHEGDSAWYCAIATIFLTVFIAKVVHVARCAAPSLHRLPIEAKWAFYRHSRDRIGDQIIHALALTSTVAGTVHARVHVVLVALPIQ